MVDAGKVTVKVELDASDVPSSLTQQVNRQLKPALASVHAEVDKTTTRIKHSVDDMGTSLGGVGAKVGKSATTALTQTEQSVDKSVSRIRHRLAEATEGIARMGGKLSGLGEGGEGMARLGESAARVTSGLAGIETAGSAAAGGLVAVGAAAAATVVAVAAVAAGVGVAGKALYDLGAEADDLQDKVRFSVGGTKESMDGLIESVHRMGSTNVPESFDKISDAAIQVKRNLGLTGDGLEQLTSRILNYDRLSGDTVNIKALAQDFKKFGLTAAEQVPAFNQLWDATRTTGLSMSELISGLDSGGLALKNVGLNFGQSAALLGQFNQAGINAQQVLPGLTIFLRNAAKAGKSGADAFQLAITQIKDMTAAGDEIGAKKLADKMFGRASLPLFDAIKEGKIDLQQLSNSMNQTGEDINAVAGETDDWAQKWVELKNKLAVALEPFGKAVFDKVQVELTKLGDWVGSHTDEIINFFVGVGDAAIDAGTFIFKGMGMAADAIASILMPIGDTLGAAYKLKAALADLTGDRAEGDRLRAEAEGFFSWGESMAKFGETARNFDPKPLHDGLHNIGKEALAGVDATKGLNDELGALPVDGVTVPIAADTSGADKAMDDLFTKYRELSVSVNLGDAAAAGVLGGALIGTGADPSVDGNAARQYAHDVMMPFWQQQGFTVGDHAADNFGEHQNGAVDVMVKSIAEGNKVLQQALRDPNAYGIIFNNQTYGYGHGATPQDYSAGHTGNPTQDHQDHVHIWYKPGDGTPPPPGAPPAAALPGMPPPVDPGAAPVPPAPAVKVPQQTVDVLPIFTPTTGNAAVDAVQAQLDELNNQKRASDASKTLTDAAQAVADAQAASAKALTERDTIVNDQWKTAEDKAKAEEAYQKSLDGLTKAQDAQTEAIGNQKRQGLQDQLTVLNQQATKVDYGKLPLGDPRRILAGAISGAGGTQDDVNSLVPALLGQAAQAAAQPIGQAAGDAAAAAINTNLLGTGTPTAPNTDTNQLLAERNPAVVGQLAGLNVPDYTRQGGDPGAVMTNTGPGFTGSGQMMSDTAVMIDRTMTNMEAANKARQDQLVALLQQIKDQVGSKVVGPIVEASTEGALKSIADEIGKTLGDTAGPIIADKTAKAVTDAMAQQQQSSSYSGTSAIPGMATGGGIYGGTPGKDSVPAMLMPGEWVFTADDVARMGGFAGVERFLGALHTNGGIRHYASGGRVATGNPNGGQNVNSTVGADFFGVSQIPVLALAINALTEVLLKLIGVEIMQRDSMIQVSKDLRDFRGDFRAFDAAGRIKNDNSGLVDRTSSSQKQAADERIRILKMVIDGIVKYIIEKIVVPLGKAIGNAIVSALAGAAGGAISSAGGGGGIAGGIVSAAISAAGAVAIDIAAEVFTIAVETLFSIGMEAIGEFLQTLFPNLTTSLFGGALMEQIAGPVSQVMIGAIGVITSTVGNLMGNLGGLFANFLPTLQNMLAGFGPLTLSLSAVVGVLSSIAALLQQILTALLNLGAGIASPIVSAVTSAMTAFLPLISNLNSTTNLLGAVAQILSGLVPNLGNMAGAVNASGATLAATLVGVGTAVNSLLRIQPPTATVNPVASAAATTASSVNQLVTALSSGTLSPVTTTTVNAPITVVSATTSTATTIANRLLALTG